MNFYFLFFAATTTTMTTTTTTSAFLTSRHYCPTTITTTTTTFVSTFQAAAANDDDDNNNNDDDWFADFDDFESEIDAKLKSSNNNNQQQQRQFAQTTSFRNTQDRPYSRDMSRDNSNVDENVVQSLLQERREAQQCRDYDTADQIRELLLNEHHVGVNDRERTWRTGCSSSGSGSKFGGGGRGGGGGGSRPRDRDFGPNGHDYSAVVDDSNNNNNKDLSGTSLSEEEIHAKLAQRLQAKLNRRYREADDIQEELIENGVYVDDGQKLWRADGQSFVDNNNNKKKNGRNRRDNSSSSSSNNYHRREYNGDSRRNMGPHGHDYNESPNAGPNNSQLGEEEIHSLLAQRLRAKKGHDFRTADAIQQELIEGGVFVHDAQKEWRADGKPFESLGTSVRNRRDPTLYAQSSYSEEVPEGLSVTTIEKLCAERIKFKLAKQYDKADGVRNGLQNRYNIFVDDRIQEWSVGGNFGSNRNQQRQLSQQRLASREYTKSVDSSSSNGDFLLLNPDDEAQVVELLQQRQEFKAERNYRQADAIRDMLRDEFNVYVEDKLRVWSVGRSNFANDQLAQQQQQQRETITTTRNNNREYTLRGNPGKLTESEIQYIETSLKERQIAKKNRNFDLADDIRNELMNDYNIAIDDRNLEWKVDNDDYVLAAGSSSSSSSSTAVDSLPSDTISYIQTQLQKRFQFKQQRMYQDADAIRDELREEYGVVINDRKKEWYVDDDDDDDDEYSSSNNHRSFDDATSSSRRVDAAPEATTTRVELKNNDDNGNDDDNNDEQSIDDKLDQAFNAMFDDLDIMEEEEDEDDDDIVLDDGLDEINNNNNDNDSDTDETLHDDIAVEAAAAAAAAVVEEDETTTTLHDVEAPPAAADVVVEEEEENDTTTTTTTTITAKNNNNDDDDDHPVLFSEEELSSLTVPKLKEELRKVGLPVSGRKADLVARLLLLLA